MVLTIPRRSGFALLLIATSIGLAGAMSAAIASGTQATSAEKKVVRIVAERFSFTPSAVTVDAGAVVEIHLTSEDTAHGFRIAGPRGVDVTIPKRGRGQIVVTFEASEPGDYVFECSRMCGAGHSFMRGRIRVKSAASREP